MVLEAALLRIFLLPFAKKQINLRPYFDFKFI